MKAQDTATKDWTTMLRADASASPGPSIVAGWQFLAVVEATDEDALPIRAVADAEGPCVVYHPELCPRSMIENPVAAMLWLPLVLDHLAHSVLAEAAASADGVGTYSSPRWQEFRQHASRAMCMTWDEIVRATRLDGVSMTAEYMTVAIFAEDGIQSALSLRMKGAPALRLV